MATEIFPDEGLDIILTIFPKGGTNLTTTYLGLWTGGTGGMAAATAAQVGTAATVANDITEVDYASYARQSIASGAWGAIAAGTGGRKTTAGQVTFPTATGNSTTTTKGFWLADILSSTGDKAIFVANFDDTTAVQINTGDILKVTPTIQYNN